jgi:hypothetical protein
MHRNQMMLTSISFEHFCGFVGEDNSNSSRTCSATPSRFTDGR